MVDFASLKKNRSKSFDALNAELSKVSSGKGNFKDPDEDKYWKPTRDAAGNAFAIVRFLPAPPDEDLPFVILYDHGFKGPNGQWYIENSRTTIGEPDPVSEYNSELWNVSPDDNSPTRKQARDQKRRKHYIAGIQVIKDSGNPDNNGKVFLYKFGAKIWGKLYDQMNPQFEDEKPVNPFDFWEGANFRIKVTGTGRDTSYDKSEFDSPSEHLGGDDEALEKLWKTQHSLKAVIAPDKFKAYDFLKAKLYRVLGLSGSTAGNASAEDDDPAEEALDMSKLGAKEAAPARAPKEEDEELSAVRKAAQAAASDDDDDLAFFQALAKS